MRTGLTHLYIPGPTNVSDDVRRAINVPMQDMRAADFGDLTLGLFDDMKSVLRTEAASRMQALGIGVSSSIGIGGDPVNGSAFKDILPLFEEDADTDDVIMIGEIGGPREAEPAAHMRDHMTKPVAAYIAGIAAPKGRQMGHAGAIISAFGESAQDKVAPPSACGIEVAPNPSAMSETVARLVSSERSAA